MSVVKTLSSETVPRMKIDCITDFAPTALISRMKLKFLCVPRITFLASRVQTTSKDQRN